MSLVLILILVLALAFANGANDNFKGVATLFGSGLLSFRSALALTTVSTFLGSALSLVFASELAKAFSGKGLVPQELLGTPGLVLAVSGAAAATLLLATRIGLPTSTTHALFGALIGVALVARGMQLPWLRALEGFAVPLAVSPVLAVLLTVLLYVPLRATRRALGIGHESCICLGLKETAPSLNSASVAEMPRAASTQLELRVADSSTCRGRYEGSVLGVEARPLAAGLHVLSGASVSFSRAVNDTPKIAALMIVLRPDLQYPALGLCAIAMALGGLLASRRVAETMSLRITELNEGQGLTANLVTSLLVLGASKLGVPVSTTHVSCGAIFGIGALTRSAKWRTVAGVGAAWLGTLPLAAVLAALAFAVLR